MRQKSLSKKLYDSQHVNLIGRQYPRNFGGEEILPTATAKISNPNGLVRGGVQGGYSYQQ